MLRDSRMEKKFKRRDRQSKVKNQKTKSQNSEWDYYIPNLPHCWFWSYLGWQFFFLSHLPYLVSILSLLTKNWWPKRAASKVPITLTPILFPCLPLSIGKPSQLEKWLTINQCCLVPSYSSPRTGLYQACLKEAMTVRVLLTQLKTGRMASARKVMKPASLSPF